MDKVRIDSFPAHWRQTDAMPEAIARELSAAAAEIRGGIEGLPILLKSICDRIGVRVMRRGSVKPGKAYLEWNQSLGESPKILLPPASENLKWDRFCTAHEIGHFVLISRYGWNPHAKSDYWRTETMCDHFARELLLPDSVITRRRPGSPRTALRKCNSIGRRANVPWIQVAKKMTQADNRFVFFNLEHLSNGRLRISYVTSLPKDKGRGTLISPRSTFFKLAIESLEIASREGLPEAKVLSREPFVGSKLGELFSELAVREAFMEASPTSGKVRLAAMR